MSVSLIDGHIDREKQTMTDNEIIKALECCSDTVNYQCNKCPLYVDCEKAVIAECALDLINRQKEQIESLIAGQETLQKALNEKIAEVEALNGNLYTVSSACKQRRDEAVKEFAER